MSVFFNGRQIITPATVSVVNDDAMRNQNLTVGNVVALLGKSGGGKPKTELRFGTPEEAKSVLRSGELLDAVLAAFDPSSETAGPSLVVAIRVDPATQASASLLNGAGNPCITLRSTDYGAYTNQIRVKVEAGSTSGKRVTTQLGSTYYTKDNIDRPMLEVEYGGSEATATVTVTSSGVSIKAGDGQAVALSFDDYPTVGHLVEAINAEDGWSAEAAEGADELLLAGVLDAATDLNAKYGVTITATTQAIIEWINSLDEGLITASRADGSSGIPANTDWVHMTGGSNGSATSTDWADAFEVLQGIDVQWVTPVSGDPAIHAMADTHVMFMSTVGRKERRAICGTAAGTSDDDAIAAAKVLNSDRTSLVHLGHYEYDADGKLALLPPYISAARIAGGFSGVNPGTPLTNKNFKCRGLERKLRNPTDTDRLITGGVLCLEETEQGYKVVKSISTWLVDDNYNRVEQSSGVALDFVARNVRNALDVLRGQKGNPLVLSRAISIAESTLRELARPEPQGPGVIVGNDESPAYRNIRASLEGDVLRVDYECSPVIPINYVLNTIYAVPFSGTATA